MIDLTSVGPTVLASFLASTVEFVEALTIVLAVGVVRGWRSALLGAAAGRALLTALTRGQGKESRVIERYGLRRSRARSDLDGALLRRAGLLRKPTMAAAR